FLRDGKLKTTWLKLGRPLVQSLVPTVVWFFLKIGLYFVGAIVFWKRPDDRSAKHFFLLCTCSLVAYVGGYNWAQLVSQPVLLTMFMAGAVLLPPVSLHLYLVFPRPKWFLESHPRWTLTVLYGPALMFFVALLYPYLEVRWLNRSGIAGAS